MTRFQQTLPQDIDTLWAIVKAYHPDIPEEGRKRLEPQQTQVKGGKWKPIQKSVYTKYDWVCVEFKVPNYGQISLRIENCNDNSHNGIGLYGPRVTKEDMQQAINKGMVTMFVNRFADDKLFKEITFPVTEKDPLALLQAITILKEKGYTIQTVNEWFKYYYSD